MERGGGGELSVNLPDGARAHKEVGDDEDDDKDGANAHSDPAMIVVVHDFAHTFADQSQPKQRGEDK